MGESSTNARKLNCIEQTSIQEEREDRDSARGNLLLSLNYICSEASRYADDFLQTVSDPAKKIVLNSPLTNEPDKVPSTIVMPGISEQNYVACPMNSKGTPKQISPVPIHGCFTKCLL